MKYFIEMAVKTGFDQHDLLHKYYPDNCCLCKAEQRIKELEKEISQLTILSQKMTWTPKRLAKRIKKTGEKVVLDKKIEQD